MTIKDLSQFDPGQNIKFAFDDSGKFLRVNNANRLVPSRYTRVVLTYNAQGSVTNAKFYYDSVAEKSIVITLADTASSLNSKYFFLNSALDETKYYIWYSVDSTGLDPLIPDKTGIRIDISENDADSIVAMATKLVLNTYPDFSVINRLNRVTITNTRNGEVADIVDGNTGFGFEIKQQGESILEANIDIPYENDVRYVWNEVEGKFEIFVAQEITGDVGIIYPNKGYCIDVDLNDVTWTALPIETIAGLQTYAIQNRTNSTIFINYEDTLSSSQGLQVLPSDERYYNIRDGLKVYAKSQSGNVTIVIEALSKV